MNKAPVLKKEYSGHQHKAFEQLAELNGYNRFIAGLFLGYVKGRKVLEIGSGTGNILEQYLDCVKSVTANDLDKKSLAILKKRFASRKLKVCSGDLLRKKSVSPGKFDAVIMVNVLEHIYDDITAVKLMLGFLRPGGVLILFVPAFNLLFSKMDRMFLHKRRYTKKVMRKLAEDAGAELKELKYINLTGFFGWLLNHRILGKTAFNEGQMKLFDRYILKYEKQIHKIGLPFGQSLFAVLGKAKK